MSDFLGKVKTITVWTVVVLILVAIFAGPQESKDLAVMIIGWIGDALSAIFEAVKGTATELKNNQ